MNLEEAITICPAPAAIVERDSRRADEVIDRLKRTDGLAVDVALEQGDLWLELEKDAHWATKGFESSEDLFKSLNLEISLREIQYRAKIVRVMDFLGIPRDEYKKAKITKLKYITELNPTGEIVDPVTEIAEPLAPIMTRLVQDAPKKSVKQVREEVDQLLGKTDEESDLTWLNLPIRRDAKEVVNNAIELAKALSGDTVDAETQEVKDLSTASALERIAADFLADPNNQLEEMGQEGSHQDTIELGPRDAVDQFYDQFKDDNWEEDPYGNVVDRPDESALEPTE